MTVFYAASPYAIPDEAVGLVVDSSTVLVTGSVGGLDWHGRPYVVRRPDGVLVMVYRSGTSHFSNDAVLHIRFSDDNGATWTDDDETLAGDAVIGFPMDVPTGNLMIGEGLPFYAPNGDLLLHTWSYTGTWGVDAVPNGTWQSRSQDGGESWTAPEGPIDWENLTGAQDLKTFSTDQFFIGPDGILYGGARTYGNDSGGVSAVVLVTSDDSGETWVRKSTLVSTADLGGEGTQEVGLVYVEDGMGNGTIIAIIRDTADVTHGYKMTSTDLGATWSSLVDFTSEIGIFSRPKLYTRAGLKGLARPELDPVLILEGFIHQTPGSSMPRRIALGVSRDRGATFDTFYLAATTDDGGYGDVFYDEDNDQYVVPVYRGTLTAADLEIHRCSIAGI